MKRGFVPNKTNNGKPNSNSESVPFHQSPIGKKMAAAHFTTIPCERDSVYKVKRKPNFYKFVAVLSTLSSLGLKIL